MIIPKLNIPQKVVLCLGALAVALRCFSPLHGVSQTIFQCIGIVIVTAVLVYLTGLVKPKIVLIVIGSLMLIFIGLILLNSLLKQKPENPFLKDKTNSSFDEWLGQEDEQQKDNK